MSAVGDQQLSSLPKTPKVVHPGLTVTAGPQSVTLDVKTPPLVRVAGRVLHNGLPPLVLQSNSQCGEVHFENANGVDHQVLPAQCASSGQIAFEGLVLSGTYRVVARGDPDEVLLPATAVPGISSISFP